jgi:hypothetical protein
MGSPRGARRRRGDHNAMPAFPVISAMRTTVFYHLGSIAFGSFIVALVQFLRVVLEYINRKTQELQNNNEVRPRRPATPGGVCSPGAHAPPRPAARRCSPSAALARHRHKRARALPCWEPALPPPHRTAPHPIPTQSNPIPTQPNPIQSNPNQPSCPGAASPLLLSGCCVFAGLGCALPLPLQAPPHPKGPSTPAPPPPHEPSLGLAFKPPAPCPPPLARRSRAG